MVITHVCLATTEYHQQAVDLLSPFNHEWCTYYLNSGVAYRHYWTDTLRSTLLYGEVEADLSGAERSQWSINLFQNLTSKLAVGAEVGQFSMDEQSVDSNYGQITLKYTL